MRVGKLERAEEELREALERETDELSGSLERETGELKESLARETGELRASFERETAEVKATLERQAEELRSALDAVAAAREESAAAREDAAAAREDLVSAVAEAAAAREDAAAARAVADRAHAIADELHIDEERRHRERVEADREAPAPAAPPTADAPPLRGPREGFDDVGQPLAVIGLDGRFEQLNPGFESLVGYSEQEFRRARWPSLVDRTTSSSTASCWLSSPPVRSSSARVETVYLHGQGLLVPVIGEMRARARRGRRAQPHRADRRRLREWRASMRRRAERRSRGAPTGA